MRVPQPLQPHPLLPMLQPPPYLSPPTRFARSLLRATPVRCHCARFNRLLGPGFYSETDREAKKWKPEVKSYTVQRTCHFRVHTWPFTHSLTHSPAHSLTHYMYPTISLDISLSHSPTRSLAHSLTHSHTHSLTPSHPPSLTHSHKVRFPKKVNELFFGHCVSGFFVHCQSAYMLVCFLYKSRPAGFISKH